MRREDHAKLFDTIQAEKRLVGGDLQPPASDAELSRLSENCVLILGHPAIPDHLDFLRITNGLSWAGVHIYARKNR